MGAHSGPADWWTEGTDKGREHVATKGIVTDGLVLNLDASVSASYPGTGTTWYDLSGNNNHVTLYNGVLYEENALYSDGTDAYGRTTNTLNLSGTNAITVVSIFKDVTTTSGFVVYEHTNNWNTVTNSYGGFGLSTNSNGSTSGSVPYGLHIQVRGNAGYAGTNANSIPLLNYFHSTVIHDFGAVSNNETNFYLNSNLYNGSGSYPSNNTGNFGNDHLYIFKRGTSNVGSQGRLSVLKIYNRALTQAEIRQNFNALRNRYSL